MTNLASVNSVHGCLVYCDLQEVFDCVNRDMFRARRNRPGRGKRALKIVLAFLTTGLVYDGWHRDPERTPNGSRLSSRRPYALDFGFRVSQGRGHLLVQCRIVSPTVELIEACPHPLGPDIHDCLCPGIIRKRLRTSLSSDFVRKDGGRDLRSGL